MIEAMAAKYPNPATPEEIWALLQEFHEGMKELREEHERLQAEAVEQQRKLQAEAAEQQAEAAARQAEAAERQAKWQAESVERQRKLDLQLAELSKNVGGLNNSMGMLVETLIAAHLWEKFPEYDLQRAYQRVWLYEGKKAIAEIDILLVNTEWAMAVEVKTNAIVSDIKEHVARMQRIIKYPPPHLLVAPQPKLLGAIAAGVITPAAAAYAHKRGFFVLELAGESVVRLPAPADFKPKEYEVTVTPGGAHCSG